jgi:hypothetical protein
MRDSQSLQKDSQSLQNPAGLRFRQSRIRKYCHRAPRDSENSLLFSQKTLGALWLVGAYVIGVLLGFQG